MTSSGNPFNGAGQFKFALVTSTNILSGGVTEADQLLMTNAAGRFEFTDGTLSVRQSTVLNGQLFRVGNGVSPATLNLAGNGFHDFSGVLAISVSANATVRGNGTLRGGLVVLNGGTLSSLSLPALDAGLSWNNRLQVDGSIEVAFGEIIQTNAAVRVMAANLSSGNNQRYETPGLNIFQVLRPDIVAIQEFSVSNSFGINTAAALSNMVATMFGPEFRFFRETNAGYTIPNGIISRYPFLTNGSWIDSDTGVNDRRGSGATPIIYCSQPYANSQLDSHLAGYDLWLRTISALDPSTNEPPAQGFASATGVFNNWSFWQYSGTGSSGGISPLDLNVCHSEFKPLITFLIPTPAPPMIPVTGIILSGGSFQFAFTNTPGAGFTVLAAPDPALPLNQWMALGAATEIAPWQFQFTDSAGDASRAAFLSVALSVTDAHQAAADELRVIRKARFDWCRAVKMPPFRR